MAAVLSRSSSTAMMPRSVAMSVMTVPPAMRKRKPTWIDSHGGRAAPCGAVDEVDDRVGGSRRSNAMPARASAAPMAASATAAFAWVTSRTPAAGPMMKLASATTLSAEKARRRRSATMTLSA